MSEDRPTPPLSVCLREKEFFLLLAVVVVYFAQPLFTDASFYFRDLQTHFLPDKQFLVESVRAGEFPLWNPDENGGKPYLAAPTAAVLYPSNVLYFLLPLLPAFDFDIVLHVLLAAAGAYLLARSTGLRPLSALVTGIVFGFCGFTLSLLNLMHHIIALSWVPWAVIGFHRFLESRRTRWFLLGVIAASLQLLAGGAEIAALCFVFLLLWCLSWDYARVSVPARLLSLALLALFTAGLCAVQIMPTLELVAHSSRELGEPDLATWSLHPMRIPEFVIPGFFGRTDTFSALEYWGASYVDRGYPLVLSIYVGLPALFLALAAGVGAGFPLRSRWRRTLLFTAALSAILAMGAHLPFFDQLGGIPVLGKLRYPIKILALGLLPIALLAGICAEAHFGRRSNPVRRARPGALGIGGSIAILASILGVTLWGDVLVRAVRSVYFPEVEIEILQPLGKAFLHSLLALLGLVALYVIRRMQAARWPSAALVALVALDLLVAGHRLNPYAPAEFYAEPPALESVRGAIGDGRLFREEIPMNVAIRAPANRDVLAMHWRRLVLDQNTTEMFDVPSIFVREVDSLSLREVDRLRRLMPALGWPERLAMLSAAGVTVIVTHEDLTPFDVEPVAAIRNDSDLTFFVYRNDRAMPRAIVANWWHYAEEPNSAAQAMLGGGFDPRSHVVLTGQGPDPTRASCAAVVSETARRGRSVDFAVSSECEGYFVLAEPLYPGWEIIVDGRKQPTRSANVAFTAAWLPSGDHRVEYRYRPRSVRVGATVSSLSVGLLLLALRVGLPRRFRGTGGPHPSS